MPPPLCRRVQAPTAAQSSLQQPTYTLDQLAGFYGLNGLRAHGYTGAGQTVAVFELAQYSASDVSSYMTCFGLTNPVNRIPVDGGAAPDPSSGTPEADLDIEQVATQAPGATVLSYESANDTYHAYDVWAAIVHQDRAKVISSSWAVCEIDAARGGEMSGAGNLSPLFRQAAAQGQTVLAASATSRSELRPTSRPSTTRKLVVDYQLDPNVTGVGGTDYYQADHDRDTLERLLRQPRPQLRAQRQLPGGRRRRGVGRRTAAVLAATRPAPRPVRRGAARFLTYRPMPATRWSHMPTVDGPPASVPASPPPFSPAWSPPGTRGCAQRTREPGPDPVRPGRQRRGQLPRSAGPPRRAMEPTGGVQHRHARRQWRALSGLERLQPGHRTRRAGGLRSHLRRGRRRIAHQRPAGTTINITGLGLEDARIYFNEGSARVPVTPTRTTATSATVVTPAAWPGR